MEQRRPPLRHLSPRGRRQPPRLPLPVLDHNDPRFGIREHSQLNAPGLYVHDFSFDLLPPAGPAISIEDRWEAMAGRLRYFCVLFQYDVFGLEIHSRDDLAGVHLIRVCNHPDQITARWLMDLFDKILHSDDTLVLEDLIFRLEDLRNGLMNDRLGGQGRPFGALHIPRRLQHYGIGTHPLAGSLNAARRAAGCGPRALVLARDPAYYSRHFREWQRDADALAEDLHLENQLLTLNDVAPLLGLEGWRHLRVLVLRQVKHYFHLLTLQHGPDWSWPTDLPKTDPDPTTIHLLLDDQKHYWWIQFPRTYFTRVLPQNPRARFCMACYGNPFHESEFAQHVCAGAGLHQCDICLRVFGHDDGLVQHRRETWEGVPCPNCRRATFNGVTCWTHHQQTACVRYDPVTKLVVPRKRCELCNTSYPDKPDHVHSCTDLGACRNCKHEYVDTDDKQSHHCTFPANTQFWTPVEETRRTNGDPVLNWNSHWFYDFETQKGEPIQPGAQVLTYKHSVLAWCLRLMVPCAQHRAFVDEQECIPVMIRLIDSDDNPHGGDIKCRVLTENTADALPTLRIWGKSLDTFIWTVEHVCALKEPKVFTWKPTLWAHNGSKFDTKFVFHHYCSDRDLDLAASRYERDYGDQRTPQLQKDGLVRWVQKTYTARKNVVRMSSIGSRILSLAVHGIRFRCSQAHLNSALRDLPHWFDLQNLVKKGEFPYELLSDENWELVLPGLPALTAYDIPSLTRKRRLEVIQWWIEEQQQHNVWLPAVLADLVDAGVTPEEIAMYVPLPWPHNPHEPPKPWSFKKALWTYLFNDVDVGARCMEAYHAKAEEMHPQARAVRNDPLLADKIVSPLSVSTSPSWALAMYTTWFMPPDTLYTLRPNEHTFVRDSLRGGRTDKRCNYVDVSGDRRAAGDKIVYYDFKSLYPSVQKCAVHDTHFPVGPPHWMSSADRRTLTSNEQLVAYMNERQLTGFLQIKTRHTRFVTHPTLHVLSNYTPVPESSEDAANQDPGEPAKADRKLLFPNADQQLATYAWPEIEEAIRCNEIEVVAVYQALLFQRGTHVFEQYVDFFFMVKEQAERSDNAGLRSLAKLLLNALWGKLGQRAYPVTEWVSHQARLDYLYHQSETGQIEFVNYVRKTPSKVFITYQNQTDYNNLACTAPHIAAFVSMWGRVMLHKKVLSVHGQRALYYDTDSALVYLRRNDVMPYAGRGLGDLTDELPDIFKKAGYDPRLYPNLYIRELVAVAPKTYAYVVMCDEPYAKVVKVVCKGFEPTWKNDKNVNFDSMKMIVWAANGLKDVLDQRRGLSDTERALPLQRCIPVASEKMQFVSSLANGQMVPHQRVLSKSLSGDYNKGRNHPHNPMLVIPFGPHVPPGATFLDFAPDPSHFE